MSYLIRKIKYNRIFEKAITFVDKYVNNSVNKLPVRLIFYLILRASPHIYN